MSTVLVIGASGFVGKHLCRAQLAAGHAVRALARTPAKVADLAAEGCEVVRGDMLDAASLRRAVAGVAGVYVCVHTLSAQSGGGAAGRGFMDLEIEGLEAIVAACRAGGVRRLVYLTSLGVAQDSAGAWTRERWRAQQLLLHSGLDVTVLQPGQIVGVGGTGFDMMVRQARKSPAVMLGSGKQRWRNIAVDDLVYYLLGVLDDPRTYGQVYEVGCDDVLTNDQMVDLTAELLGRPRPAKIHVPPALLSLLAPLVERLAKLPKGAIKGLADSLGTDAVGDPAPIRAVLPRPPVSYRQAVARALNISQGQTP